MKIQEHKKTGITTRELTQEELVEYAERGDTTARKEIYLKADKTTIEERLKALEDMHK